MSILRLCSGFTTGGVKLIIKTLTGPSDFNNPIICQNVRCLFFLGMRGVEYRIIERYEMGPGQGNLTMEEVLQREYRLKLALAFIMEYIKVGKEWKV